MLIIIIIKLQLTSKVFPGDACMATGGMPPAREYAHVTMDINGPTKTSLSGTGKHKIQNTKHTNTNTNKNLSVAEITAQCYAIRIFAFEWGYMFYRTVAQ